LNIPPGSLKHKQNREEELNTMRAKPPTPGFYFKEFSKSVYSLFGSYLRLMSVEDIENEMRNVAHALVVDMRSKEHKQNFIQKTSKNRFATCSRIKTLNEIVKDINWKYRHTIIAPASGETEEHDTDTKRAVDTFAAYVKAKELERLREMLREATKKVNRWYVEE